VEPVRNGCLQPRSERNAFNSADHTPLGGGIWTRRLSKLMKSYGQPHVIETDKRRSYGAAMKVIGNDVRQEAGRWLNNRVENSHLPFQRRERAIAKFRNAKSLQKSAALHTSIQNHLTQERHLSAAKTSSTTDLSLWQSGSNLQPVIRPIQNPFCPLIIAMTKPQPVIAMY